MACQWHEGQTKEDMEALLRSKGFKPYRNYWVNREGEDTVKAKPIWLEGTNPKVWGIQVD